MNRCVWPILRWQVRFQVHEADGGQLESVWWGRLRARVRRIWVHDMQGAGNGAGRKSKASWFGGTEKQRHYSPKMRPKIGSQARKPALILQRLLSKTPLPRATVDS